MQNLSRRQVLRATALAPVFQIIGRAAKATDVMVQEINFGYEDYLYRTPIKFGGSVVDRVTLLNVDCVVKNKAGKTAKGFGSMPMGNVWSFPSKQMTYDETLGAMKALADRILAIIRKYTEYGHPVDIGHNLEPEFAKAAAEVSRDLRLKEPIPHLCTLCTASPFDASIHDAFGKLYGLSCYKTYGPDFMSYDLSHYLGPKFKGEYLSQYVQQTPKPRMPMYHLVGAVDPIVEADIKKRINDGLPETLPEWINYNGLTNIKIKLNGDDVKWDIDRVVRVEKTTAETQAKRGVSKWVYSLDFNERCPNVGYLLEFLKKVKEQAPAGFDRIQYIEQPTARDLKANRHNVMHEASKLRPVVIDESLSDVAALDLAQEMGYTGAALKACKGQTQALLMAAAAQKKRMFLCVQDLTCPGASLIHSAGLSAHVPGVAAIEANSRQYVPIANKEWVKKLPEIFVVKDGTMRTAVLNRPGLSAV
jgi:L-alanine-DL-glutamate epimerase-like enolase superfamily enzyme